RGGSHAAPIRRRQSRPGGRLPGVKRFAYHRTTGRLPPTGPPRTSTTASSSGTLEACGSRCSHGILETEGLTKEFRGFVAVQRVNLSVRRGTIHALIGPNGAGKTTCFNLLTKFLTPTSGRIVYNGREISAARPADIARLGLVRSFQ